MKKDFKKKFDTVTLRGLLGDKHMWGRSPVSTRSLCAAAPFCIIEL